MIDFKEIKPSSECKKLMIENDFKDVFEIQKSIIKKYRKILWSPFIKGLKEYEMINDGDKIAVCISGGKDSLLLAKMIEELHNHSSIKFEFVCIAMNPGFNKVNYDILENSCNKLGINVIIFDTQIFSIVDKIANDFPCYMCARMRRGALYEFAQSLGCNKIALGHHYDDFIETTMLNVLYAGNFKTMMPKLRAANYKQMELIRPMVYVREESIIKYTKENGIQAMNCGCTVVAQKTSSKRSEVKKLLAQMRMHNKEFDKSIFASTTNVNIDSIIGWQQKNKKNSFLDEY